MSTLLTAHDISKAWPSHDLFHRIRLQLAEGDRVGLIGPNGAGKSTLLKILAGLEEPDEGEIIRRRGLRVAYIAQDDRFAEDATPRSAAMEAIALDGPGDGRVDEQTRASIALSKLGFEDVDRPVRVLSGGWRKRLALACGLVRDPDLLLLDEPTNHLDLAGVAWLETFASRSPVAMAFITHDRRFLEKVANRVVELSGAYPDGTFEVDGNYSEFVRRKGEFLEAAAAARASLANAVRRDDAWLRQGIQGRQTRNKSQVKDATDRRGALSNAKDRAGAEARATTIDFTATQRRTRKLVELHGVEKSLGGRRLFSEVDLVLSPGMRLGLVGDNGTGKTTLMRIIDGDLDPDQGEVERADKLRSVVFSQHRTTLNPEDTLQQALCPIGDRIDFRGGTIHVAGWAERFLFHKDQLKTPVARLSGGEQARVLVANLMLQPADVLLLDEPTNDLDIPSLEVLEEALVDFPGAIVLVTHDRFMLDRIATEYIGLDGRGGAKSYQTLDQFTRDIADRITDEPRRRKDATPAPDKLAATGGSKRRKLGYKEQREFDAMEETILEAETEVERLEAIANDASNSADHQRSAAAFTELSSAQDRVRDLYARWSELESIQSGGTASS
ncbi:MAG: ABC-F family ATP-binding cassette domain-containing protein [Phycisphaera sp.]|nr:ABC-F family ATP-binding cassette domain-containing protein [Phycisphaera sp.]